MTMRNLPTQFAEPWAAGPDDVVGPDYEDPDFLDADECGWLGLDETGRNLNPDFPYRRSRLDAASLRALADYHLQQCPAAAVDALGPILDEFVRRSVDLDRVVREEVSA